MGRGLKMQLFAPENMNVTSPLGAAPSLKAEALNMDCRDGMERWWFWTSPLEPQPSPRLHRDDLLRDEVNTWTELRARSKQENALKCHSTGYHTKPSLQKNIPTK